MNRMFSFSEFRNNSIKDWNVSNVDNMEFLFYKSFYNGNLSKWDVSNVTNMGYMFYDSNFNNDSLKNWNVSNVKNIDFIFFSSKFNGNVSSWNVSNITIMRSAFDLCNFDGDISKWEFNKKVYCEDIFCDNYNFKNKYNSGKEIPHETKDFLEWFKENRINIANANITKNEILDIDDYLDNFEIKELKND